MASLSIAKQRNANIVILAISNRSHYIIHST